MNVTDQFDCLESTNNISYAKVSQCQKSRIASNAFFVEY